MANYPGTLPSLTNPVSTDAVATVDHASQHSNANDEIEAIATELGTLAKGGYGTVKARLEGIEADVLTKVGNITGGALQFTRYNATSDGLEASGTVIGDLQQAVGGAVEDNFYAFNASGFAKDSGFTSTDFATSAHTHDTRYYQESEVDTLLAAKEDAGVAATLDAAHLATHTSSVEHDPFVVGSVTIDETDQADNKILYFHFESNSIKYGSVNDVQQEQVEDWVAALIQDGAGITWTYDDAGGTLTGNTAWTDGGTYLYPTNTEAVVIGATAQAPDTNERLHIFAGAGGINAHALSQVVIEDNASVALEFITGATNTGYILFSDTSSATGQFGYDHSTSKFFLNGGGSSFLEMTPTATIFNEGGNDIDFRVEGNTTPYMFQVDAGVNRVLIQGPPGVDGTVFLVQRDGGSDYLTVISGDGGGQAEVVLNENGVNQDFRVEGDTDTDLLFVDASTDTVQIGLLNINGAFTLPTTDGAANQILKTDGLGTVTWQADAGAAGAIWTDGGGFVHPTAVGNEVSIGVAAVHGTESLRVYRGAPGGGAVNAASVVTVENSTNAYIEIQTTAATEGGLLFSDDAAANAKVAYDHGADSLYFQTSSCRFHMNTDSYVFNENSADIDFRIESNNETHMLFINAGQDALFIRQNVHLGNIAGFTPNMQMSGLNEADAGFSLIEWANDTTYPNIILGKSLGGSIGSYTEPVAQDCGALTFCAANGANMNDIMAQVVGGKHHATQPRGRLDFYTSNSAGTLVNNMRISEGTGLSSNGTFTHQSITDTNQDAFRVQTSGGTDIFNVHPDSTGATAASRRVTCTSDGGTIDRLDGTGVALHVHASGTTLPAIASQTAMIIQRSSTANHLCHLSIISGNNTSGVIYFGDTDSETQGRIVYDHANSEMRFGGNGSANRLEIESNGTLNVAGTGNYETLVTDDDDIPNKKYVDDATGGGGLSTSLLLMGG